MLGFYEGFPATVHKTMYFTSYVSNRSMQQKLTKSLHAMNSQTFSLEKLADPSIPECSANFEFGIAEGGGFTYLDDEETARVLKLLRKKPLQTIDLYCVVRYHRLQWEKKTPLRFDYYMIRFMFNKGLMEAQVFHERGLRYVSPEDAVNAIVNKINEASLKKMLKEVP
jgi:hypothetical protein